MISSHKKRGRPPALIAEELRQKWIMFIHELVQKYPSEHNRSLKRMVLRQKVMSGGTFDTLTNEMVRKGWLLPVYKGKKKFYRIPDRATMEKEFSINIEGFVNDCDDNVNRLQREYDKWYLQDKKIISTNYLKNQLIVINAIICLSVISGNEKREYAHAQRNLTENMRKIFQVIEADTTTSDSVIPFVISSLKNMRLHWGVA